MAYYLTKYIVFLLLISSLLTGCSYFTAGIFIDENRNAELSSKDVFDDITNKIVYLDQNWDAQDSIWFYNTTQGSNLMPYAMFLHLEQSDTLALFRSADNLRRFRYLTQSPNYANPDGLPVGFVKDTYQDKEYIGFTCAACHTTQINYQGTGIRIDGGPAMADMESMLLELAKALKSSLDDPPKFERLARNVLGNNYDTEQQSFQQLLRQVYESQVFYNQSNAPIHGSESVHYGYSRLDAFGRIYNRILSRLTPNDKENFNPANAPVSYPFLWDTPQSDFVQWNGVGDNRAKGVAGSLGPLGRNVGEVMGVFANFNLENDGTKIGYQSSVNKFNLERLERHIQKLQSPQWPENILPEIDQTLAAQGKQVYREYRCGWCHDGGKSIVPPSAEFDRSESDRLMIAQFSTMPWIRTDIQMQKNAFSYEGKMGLFESKAISLGGEEKFGEKSTVLPALSKAAQGVIIAPDYDKWPIRRWVDQAFLFLRALASNNVPPTERHNNFDIIAKDTTMLEAYKGRTLNGIWATAPYLHNGSVPNLYQLFLPKCSNAEIETGKKCRANSFTVGSREFDPINVGFIRKSKEKYPELFLFDSAKPSNSNYGHEYAAGITPIIELDAKGQPKLDDNGKPKSFTLPPISDVDRLALVEYLKTL